MNDYDDGPKIRYDWARYPCPTCNVKPDERCRAKSGRTTDAHATRRDLPIMRRLQLQREARERSLINAQRRTGKSF